MSTTPKPCRDPRYWGFDVDRYLNPFLPPPPWRHLPRPISRFFGYRVTKPPNWGNLSVIFWAFIGVFCGISLIAVVSKHIPSFEAHGAPIIIGSFGAAAVLEFYSIESPLSQPRNAIVGQLLASLTGVSICKLFLLSSRFDEVRWVGGALACAAATSVMAITKTVHPPAGATALLAVVDDNVVRLGWFLIPIMLCGCGLMLVVALIVNNIQRQFPMYWWTPEDLRATTLPWVRRDVDLEKQLSTPSAAQTAREPDDTVTETDEEESQAGSSSDDDDGKQRQRKEKRSDSESTVRDSARAPHEVDLIIRPGEVIVPEHMYITPEERMLLESLSHRI
ncbi:HPP family protein [Plectosphaerella plurivora]|uniref:HPP family protein n=1 Tax=Plectosphaerella plurivora TaxID=936078 RepID=A0A9P8VEF7_9PEZI|nr:HPP family protein [Plectosphaerella plurivora]